MHVGALQSVSAHRRRGDERTLRNQIGAVLRLHVIRYSGFAGGRRRR